MKSVSFNFLLASMNRWGARIRFLQLLLVLTLLLPGLALLAGCSHTHGLQMTTERISFIQKGTTTRTEVVENLGPPLFDLGPERTIAYAWETESSMNTGYTVFGSYHEIEKKASRWLFCVHFDESNKVDRSGKTKQPDTETATDSILKWLNSKGSSPKRVGDSA
jgi:hypothetical protein